MKRLTGEQKKRAARVLCELRGQDPDMCIDKDGGEFVYFDQAMSDVHEFEQIVIAIMTVQDEDAHLLGD